MTQQQPHTYSRRSFLRTLGLGTVGAVLGCAAAGRLTANWYQSQLNSPANPMQGVQVPAVTHVTPSGIRVHNIQTGYVAVKQAHRQYEGPDGSGLLAIAADSSWTGWMPVNTWMIEHPEGVIVVDTGETARATQPGYYLRGDQFFYGSFLRFALAEEDEIGPQLTSLGIPPQEVRWVVQTHLHGDHMGGMGYFNNADFLISPADYPSSIGAIPYRYPEWLEPTLVGFDGEPVGAFSGSYPISRAGDVFIVPTPGHSLGHQSVILRDGDLHYFFAGDTSFDDVQLLNVDTAGIAADPSRSRDTLRQIQDYCRAFDTVYLPSHDPASRARLLADSITAA